MSVLLAPSILSADFAALGDEVRRVEAAGADWIHVDVMDGRFVPNLSFGIPVLAALRRVATCPLDVHLMIVEPDRYVEAFAEAGAARLIVHVEAVTHLNRCLARISELGVQAGVALNPSTPVTALDEVLHLLDTVLVMSVNPGFGGQRYLASSTDKVRRVREILDRANSRARLEVDGGIDAGNVEAVVAAGADVLVAGSSVFQSGDVAAAMRSLREGAQRGEAGRQRNTA